MLRCMPRRRLTTLLVVLAVAPVLLAAPVAEAAFAPSPVRGAAGTALDRPADVATIRANLERRLVQQRLVDLGVDPAEASARLDQLTDQELHAAADQMRALVPGGDGVGLVIGVLLIALLVIVILKLLNKEIIIK
jgi:hypothetical protein